MHSTSVRINGVRARLDTIVCTVPEAPAVIQNEQHSRLPKSSNSDTIRLAKELDIATGRAASIEVFSPLIPCIHRVTANTKKTAAIRGKLLATSTTSMISDSTLVDRALMNVLAGR